MGQSSRSQDENKSSAIAGMRDRGWEAKMNWNYKSVTASQKLTVGWNTAKVVGETSSEGFQEDNYDREVWYWTTVREFYFLSSIDMQRTTLKYEEADQDLF